MKIMHTHIIQTKDHYAYVKNGNGSFSGSNCLVKVIGLKLRLLIKEIVLPTVIATKQRFGIMAEWLELPLLFLWSVYK